MTKWSEKLSNCEEQVNAAPQVSEESLGRDEALRQTSHGYFTSIWQLFTFCIIKKKITPPNFKESLGDEVHEGLKRQNEGCTLGVSFKILMIEQTRDFKTSDAYSN